MSEFAKLFGSGDKQIVVFLQENDEDGKPEVRVFYQPKDFGICSVAIGFEDTDEGWEKAEKSFNAFDEERSRAVVDRVMADFNLAGERNPEEDEE